MKTVVLKDERRDLVRSKIVINNNNILEQINAFS
jgi:hypothetical protein